MGKKYSESLKKVLFVAVNLALLPCMYFYQLSNGLDPSWVFALNYINVNGGKFGEDYFFTYGPLGFLGRCQMVGNNFYIGIVFWMCIAVIQIYLFRRIFQKAGGAVSLAAAVVFVLLASPMTEADIYLFYLDLLAVLLVYKHHDFYSHFIAFFLSGILFLFKFSEAMLIVASMAMFIVCIILERKAVKKVLFYLGNIVIGPLFFLGYCPSLSSLMHYIKAGVEVSSGYNLYMSVETYRAYMIWVILLGVCWMFLLVHGFWKKKKDWDLFLILAPSCFLWYKEGFVRNDTHYISALVGMLLICSILFFFVDWKLWMEGTGESITPKIVVGAVCILSAVPIMGKGQTVSGALLACASNAFNFPKAIDDCYMQDRNGLQEHNAAFMDVIGDETYTTLPWEITENISYSNRHFMISPSIHNLMAYTPYMDSLNAEFYTGEGAPEYIIMYLYTIDGRLPLIETPATWENIYRNYCVVASDEEKYLLKKRGQALGKELTGQVRKTYGINDVIDIPEGCNYVKIDAKLGLKGNIEKVLYKILAVNMKITYSDGSVREGRVILDNLSEGIVLDSLIWDNADFVDYMEMNVRNKTVKNISLTGKGVKQYKQSVDVTFGSVAWDFQ